MWKFICKICSCHDIAEILLQLVLNINHVHPVFENAGKYRPENTIRWTLSNNQSILCISFGYRKIAFMRFLKYPSVTTQSR
jgi:hypothetical protein